ncbi:MAG: SCO family protein [Mariprofundaceae bacterium]|nr:SCO family protein [Mariprofundaceae bacterium]
MRPIVLVHVVVSILMLAVWTPAYAQASTDGGFLANAKNRLQGPEQHSALNMKAFGKDFDSDKALKNSQNVIGQTLSGYTFHDRNGKLVKLSDFYGKPLLISLIYTSCFHICPATTQNLARAVKATRSAVGKDKFSIVTIGFDTLHDTPERMSGFARQQGVSNEHHWRFLSADKTSITRLATDLGFIFVPSPKGFDHLIQTTVVDKGGEIYRQIYGMNFDPSNLTEAMKELVFGLSPETLSLSSLVNRARLFCTVYDPSTGTYQFNYAMIFGMSVGVLMLSVSGFFLVRFLRYS